MSLIIVKKKGVDIPKKEILFLSFNDNQEGLSVMFNDGKNVHIRYDFNDFDDYYRYILEMDQSHNLKYQDCVFCFESEKFKNRCYDQNPHFVNLKMFNHREYLASVGIASYGEIPNYHDNRTDCSDVYNFSKKVIQTFFNYDDSFIENTNITYVIKQLVNTEMVIMDADYVLMVGNFIAQDNLFYSKSIDINSVKLEKKSSKYLHSRERFDDIILNYEAKTVDRNKFNNDNYSYLRDNEYALSLDEKRKFSNSKLNKFAYDKDNVLYDVANKSKKLTKIEKVKIIKKR